MKKGAKGAAAVAGLLLAGCHGDHDLPQREPPPPVAAARPGACSAGGGKLTDADGAKTFPRTLAGFCIDPNGSEKTFGDGAQQPLDHICDLFDGECEIYKGFGARRVLALRYVDGGGSAATIDAYASKFGTSEGAYAMFTKRVVGDGDPASAGTPKPLPGPGAAAVGKGNAYVWRGQYLVELTYADEAAAEAALDAASQKLLVPLADEVAKALPGDAALLPAAAALPQQDLVPLGIRYVPKDLLGIAGLGGGAFGYYASGTKRYRFVIPARGDEDQAKDAETALAKVAGATKEKSVGEHAYRFMHKEGADGMEVEWIFARSGPRIVGIGDEPRAMKRGMSADESARVTLTTAEKAARLKAVIDTR